MTPFRETLRFAGTGSGWFDAPITSLAQGVAGEAREICVRQGVGDNLGGLVVWLVAPVVPVDARPDDLDVFACVDIVDGMPGRIATDPKIGAWSTFDPPAVAGADRRKRCALEVDAVGDWVVYVVIAGVRAE